MLGASMLPSCVHDYKPVYRSPAPSRRRARWCAGSAGGGRASSGSSSRRCADRSDIFSAPANIFTCKIFLQRQSNKITPVSLAPRTLEEAPLRRMDRRALNALRKRRADKHMIAFLILLGVLGIAAGVAAIVVWVQYRWVVSVIGFNDLTFNV